VQVTGLVEFRRGISRVDAAARRALRGAAHTVAVRLTQRITAAARGYGWRTLPGEIRLYDEPQRSQYRVAVEPRPPRPRNLPIWLEYGTVKMSARPFIGPAQRDAEREYLPEAERALQAALDAEVGD
jgi:hypothetical protein